MKKIVAALAMGVVGVVGVFFARAEGLLTAELVRESLVSVLYVVLSILSSWLITATVGNRHRAMAIGTGFGVYLGVQAWRWYALDIAFAPWQLFVALIVGVSSPLLFDVSRAAFARFGIKLRVNEETGVLESIKIDDDETVFIGSPTVPDMKRVSDSGTGNVKPDPSNE